MLNRRSIGLGSAGATLSMMLGASALAQPVVVRPLVVTGDEYNGAAISTGFAASDNLSINNAGVWLVKTDTNGPATSDGLIVTGVGSTLPGSVLWAEGNPVAAPAGALISSFDSMSINAAGNVSYNFFFSGVGTSLDSGVYFNTAPVVTEGQTSATAGLSADTPYIGWFETYLNDNNQVLMVSSVDDPAIASTVDRAVVLVDNPGTGTQALTSLLREGQEVVTGRFLADVATGPHNTAFANGPRALVIPDLDGLGTDDTGVLSYDSATTTWSFLIREGDSAAPAVPGRLWGNFSSSNPIHMNNAGDWVVRASLNAPTTDDSVIVKNGTTVIAREGSGNAAIGSFVFTGFGTGAVRIDAAGNVYYYGTWNDPDTTRNEGLFKNSQLLVQTGVTVMDNGQIVTDISGVQDNFSISPDGKWLLFEGVWQDTVNVATRSGAFQVRIACPADFNGMGGVTVQDIFDFLAAWFASSPTADFNGMGGVTVQDIFDFLAAWFSTCS